MARNAVGLRSSLSRLGPIRQLAAELEAVAPYMRVATAQLAALAVTLLSLLVDEPDADRGQALVAVGIVTGIGALRILSVRRSLALATLVLDAVAIAILLAGTGAPASPFFFFGVAGAWWAAHVRRPRGWAAYAVAYTVTYSVLVLPDAVRGGMLVLALEDLAMVAIIAALAAWFVRVDRRAVELSEALAQAPKGAEELALRAGLTRALGVTDVPVDIVLAAARSGLTFVQAELLAYLAMGLTNREIADATSVGESTVRYRLTRLYRQLGVRGRKAAVARAHELGLVLNTGSAVSNARGPSR